MQDKPGLLEACYFEVFFSAALPFNTSCLFTRDDEIKSATFDSLAESHTFWPVWLYFVIINTYFKS